ncbi:MAG TPA: tetratricopeptide repeat protein [Planktothrix sp.]
MIRARNQRGFVSLGCLATMAAFTALNRATDSTVSAPQPAKPAHEGHIVVQSGEVKPWQDSFDAGNAVYQSGRYQEAYKMWAETLKLAEHQKAASKFDDARALPILDKMALLYKTQNQPEKAAEMYERSIAIASKAYGKSSTQVAHLMLLLSHEFLYGAGKDLMKAEELLTEAFEINEKIYGRMTIPAGDVAIALAQLEEDRKDFKKAAEYWKLAVDIGNICEPNVISCCRIGPRQGLSRCYQKLGLLDDALDVHKELVAMCKQGAQNMLPTVLTAYSECLEQAGRHTEAVTVLAEIKH